MAIKTDNARISVDFVYEDEKTGQTFKIKLHCTETYGHTFSISGAIGGFTEGDSQYLCLPAELLTEAVDFAREKKYLKKESSQTVATPPSPKRMENFMQWSNSPPSIVANNIVSSLPTPILDGESNDDVEPEEEEILFKEEKAPKAARSTKTPRPVHKLTASEEYENIKRIEQPLPLESNILSDEDLGEDNEIPVHDEDEFMPGDEDIELINPEKDDDEMAKRIRDMAQERQVAKSKSKPPKKSVRRSKHEDIKSKIRKQLEEDDIPEADDE